MNRSQTALRRRANCARRAAARPQHRALTSHHAEYSRNPTQCTSVATKPNRCKLQAIACARPQRCADERVDRSEAAATAGAIDGTTGATALFDAELRRMAKRAGKRRGGAKTRHGMTWHGRFDLRSVKAEPGSLTAEELYGTHRRDGLSTAGRVHTHSSVGCDNTAALHEYLAACPIDPKPSWQRTSHWLLSRRTAFARSEHGGPPVGTLATQPVRVLCKECSAFPTSRKRKRYAQGTNTCNAPGRVRETAPALCKPPTRSRRHRG